MAVGPILEVDQNICTSMKYQYCSPPTDICSQNIHIMQGLCAEVNSFCGLCRVPKIWHSIIPNKTISRYQAGDGSVPDWPLGNNGQSALKPTNPVFCLVQEHCSVEILRLFRDKGAICYICI